MRFLYATIIFAIPLFPNVIGCLAETPSQLTFHNVELTEVASSQSPVTECSNPPRGQCAFYANCLEAKYHCGPSGYPTGYGTRLCEKFSASRNQFTSAGQKWMLDTMQCLQTALVPEATGTLHTTCQTLEDKAFSTHPGCYLSNGLCSLPMSDWLEIVKVLQLKTLLQSWDAFKGTVEAAEGCLEFYAFLLLL